MWCEARRGSSSITGDEMDGQVSGYMGDGTL